MAQSPCSVCGGACCKSIAFHKSWFAKSELEWVQFHGTFDGEKVRFPVACQHLKSGSCSIYADRPEPCRTYDVGSKACREAIKLYSPEKETEILSLMEVHNGTR